MMPVSIYDIAKEANVSPSTVSRALQDHPYIGEKTKARIQNLAREMGYIPSAVAQSLVTNKTWTIGVVITTVADPAVTEVVDGIEQVAQDANYAVFLSNSRNDPQREVAVVDTFRRRRVDAIIVVASRAGSTYGSLQNQYSVPILLVEPQEYGGYYHSILTDNKGGAIQAVEHLIALGHRQIGYIGATDRPKSNNERFLGYKMALTQAKIPVILELISLPDCANDIERGQMGLDDVLAAKATAVFCYNDRTAIGVMNACHQRGIEVPHDLSVVGYDDIEAAAYFKPALTTIRQERFQLGQLAMQMTLNLINEEAVQDKILPCNLVVRQSTAAIAS